MPKVRLSHDVCLTARCAEGKKKTDYYDDAITGFVLECRSTGGRTYYLRYSDAHGALRQRKIGRWEDVPFAKAKAMAQRLRAEVVMGGDPAADKAKRRATPLYAELAAQHLADAKLHQRRPENTERILRVHLVPRWGMVRVSEIDRRAVAQWLAEKRAGGLAPATVEKIRVVLGRSFELGASWEVPGCDRPNPARGLPRKPLNNARDRFLTAEEATRLREAASASKNTQLRPIVDLLLLTGARLRELLDARWEHVDTERQLWLIPMSKTGKARHVPLSSAALEVIAGLRRFEGCPWLIPNPATRRPFTNIKHPWQTARGAAGLPGLRLHDLRHAFASFAVNAGVDIFQVGRLLGHASVQSTQRYSHLANDTLLAAVEAGAAKQVIG